VLGNIREWDWNIFAFEQKELLPVLVQIFAHFNFFETFNIAV